MPVYTYRAKGSDGNEMEGTVDALGQSAAEAKLRALRLSPIEVREKTGFDLRGLFKRKPKVTSKDLVIFSRQLSTLVSAGVPIVQGLGILESQCENPTFKEVLGEVRRDIESGLSISDSLRRYPQAFPELYTAMVRAGELGGILETILARLTTYLENAEALKAKVKSAMSYPGIMLAICALVTVFLMVFVIPTFERIFASFNAELPFLTQVLIDTANLMKRDFAVILLLPIGFWYGFQRFYAMPRGRRWVDSKMLDLPVFGILLKKVAVARFTRTLGTLVRSGVPIMQALETVASTAGNVVIGEAVLAARESIREGGRLGDPLRKSGVFPSMVTSMISVGEETGALDVMLGKIADFYDQEVDAAVKSLTSMIEPLVICVMGVVIGTIVIAMFLPMFGISELAGKQ